MGELWDVYNSKREKIGKVIERGKEWLGENEYHLVVFGWIFDKDKNLLITRRDPKKPFGLMWECTGGSVTIGEDTLQGIQREIREETGLELDKNSFKLIGTEIENNIIVDVYISVLDKIDISKVKLQENETVEAKIVSLEEFKNMMKSEQVAPNVCECYERHLKNL